MVKVLIMNDLNHNLNLSKLVVYNKESDKKPKARLFTYEICDPSEDYQYGIGLNYEDIDLEQYNKIISFFGDN